MAARKTKAAAVAEEKPKRLDETVQIIEFGSDEHEQMIAIGYGGMTVEMAQTIVKERTERPELWPWEEYQKAQAVILANSSAPIVVSTRQGWKRGKG